KQAAIELENKRIQDEAEARKREEARLAAIELEKKAKVAEAERKAAEKKAKLLAVKCADSSTAFKKIYDLCNGCSQKTQAEVLCEISDIAEAHINA
ncbi:MAG: hypothetical protein ACOYNU_09720, partial [Bacteroidales bacterium]